MYKILIGIKDAERLNCFFLTRWLFCCKHVNSKVNQSKRHDFSLSRNKLHALLPNYECTRKQLFELMKHHQKPHSLNFF